MMALELNMLKLRAIFQAEEAGELPPFLVSTIRGVLGHAMRDGVCVKPNLRCHLCELADQCDYTAYFSTAGNIAGSVNPFVLHVPLQNKTTWQRGDLLRFDITVFGRTTTAADFYVNGLLKMAEYGWGAKRLKFTPVQILNAFDKSLVWSNGVMWPENLRPNVTKARGRKTDSVLIRFDAPTRVVVKQKLQEKLTFELIIKAILTRIRLLLHAYEGTLLDWDEAAILAHAREIETVEENWQFIDFKRYSQTRKGKLELPAIRGYARFCGDLTPFTPLLEIGEIVHIGKNTTHGFGNYELYYI